jgi:hypothetical protein
MKASNSPPFRSNGVPFSLVEAPRGRYAAVVNANVDLHDYFEGFSFEYRGLLRVPWNSRKTKLDGKLELVENPGLNRTKINNFRIGVKMYDVSHTIDFGEVNGKLMQEYVVECYVELTATNVFTTEVQVLDRWPSNLGENYQDAGNQYPVEDGPPKKLNVVAKRALSAPTSTRRSKVRKPKR